MDVGKQVRLNRLFSNPSGRFCSVAIDHFIGYQTGLPTGLRDLPGILEKLIPAGPDAVTMHKGVVKACWQPYAGRVPLILQSLIARPDDTVNEQLAVPEDALRLGADAFACAAFVRGQTEGVYLRRVANMVRQAEAWDMPVILHIYPRKASGANKVEISFDPEDIAWAIRCGIELGVDVIKVPFSGDVKSFGDLVCITPLPIVAAGGPKAKTFRDALGLACMVRESGAKGMTIGRNIWGVPQVTEALVAFKAVVHEGLNPQQAMKKAGI